MLEAASFHRKVASNLNFLTFVLHFMLDPDPNPVPEQESECITVPFPQHCFLQFAVGGGAVGMCVVGKGNGTGV